MQTNFTKALGAALLTGALAWQTAGADVTNTVPWSDAFESYANGATVVGANGWSAESPGGAVATNAAGLVPLLADYTNSLPGVRSFPLPATNHAVILQTTTMATNSILGATGGVVAVEFMVLPVAQAVPPPVSTNLHYAFYVDTSSNLVIWHQNRTGGATNNEWRPLTNGLAISTNAWSRFTIVQDYGHLMFQVRVNENTNAAADSAGWSSPGPGATQPGSWFCMVKTNAWLSHVMLGGDDTNYVDDLLLTNRCVTWSTNGFVESVANDGTIDTNTTVTMAVRYDTFAATNGQALDPSVFTVANLPAGLTGVVTCVDATHARLTLSGRASPNEASNSVANLTVTLNDGAFALGNAADVVGRSDNAIAVTFQNSAGIGTLTYSGTHFGEAAVNDGSIGNTLTLRLAGATFTNLSPLVAGTHYTVSNVPQGLTFVLDRSDATTAVARLTNNATVHTAAASTNIALMFLPAAFPGASSVIGSVTNLAVDFVDPPVLNYSGTNFAEAAANDGTITSVIAITLTGDTFVNGPFVAGIHYTTSAVPADLALVLTRSSATTVTVSLTGTASAHAAANSVPDLGFSFLSAAFSTVAAGNIIGSAPTIGISFLDPPVLHCDAGTIFVEAPANNGSIGGPLTITLTGDTFANAAFVASNQYTVANVPAGLTFSLSRDSGTQLTASLAGQADNHRSADDIGNLTVTFLDAAFNTVHAANVVGHPLAFAVTFNDQPVLTYSGNNFQETAGGLIDNRAPLTITLSGDTFAADVANRIAVTNLPAGLAAAFSRDSGAQVSVSLNGAATSHASVNSISNLTFTFQAGAFANADANQVDNYLKNDLRVTFIDEFEFFNVVPYGESFEDYASGLWLAGTNGWTADYYADAGIVSSDPAVGANELGYLRSHPQFPLVTNHVQMLAIKDTLRTAIHSQSNALVYLDFMTQPVALREVPDSNTNVQYAFYVSTNLQLVIWHRNCAGGTPANEWRTLQNGPQIDTSRWVRFTVAQDYTHNLFQLRVNEHDPIVDPAGWTEGGVALTGSWFHMVQTNGTMSHFIVSGLGQSYLDDLTVRTSLPASFGGSPGTIFEFR